MGYVILILALLGIALIIIEWFWNLIKAVAGFVWTFIKFIWIPVLILLCALILWELINIALERFVNSKNVFSKKLKELYDEAQKIPRPVNINLTAEPLKVSAGELPEEIFFIKYHNQIQSQIDLINSNQQYCTDIKSRYYLILQEYQNRSEHPALFERYVIKRYTRKISNVVNNMPKTFQADVAFSQYGTTKKVQYTFNEIVDYNNRYEELVANLEKRRQHSREIEAQQRQQAEQKRREEAAEQARRQRAEEQRKANIQRERSKLSASLRYDVLKRDNFRCVICGRSASDGVTLHVDHIKPVSKGGKTELSNLRTLCDYCNLGKSNKYDPHGVN